MASDQTDAPSSSPPLPAQRPLEGLDPQIRSIQPGGGYCMQLELIWGSIRRGYLKRFRPGYVQRMRASRKGEAVEYPHEILDPRDAKYYRNLGGFYWAPEDDPFTWRDRLPVVRVGLAELMLLGGGFLLATVVLGYFFWPAAVVPALLAAEILWFFRNPRRAIPTDPGLIVSPADGRVAAIEEVAHDEEIGGPAVVIGIFLSVFNVHINRAPAATRLLGVRYRPGKFLNALRPESARENEALELSLEQLVPTRRPMRVRQITGAIARRIVCWAAPGEHLARGAQFGMIKLGSRTEITLPREPGLEVRVRVGDKVQAGKSIIAQYDGDPADEIDAAER